jgi:hypothetical protein
MIFLNPHRLFSDFGNNSRYCVGTAVSLGKITLPYEKITLHQKRIRQIKRITNY